MLECLASMTNVRLEMESAYVNKQSAPSVQHRLQHKLHICQTFFSQGQNQVSAPLLVLCQSWTVKYSL